MLADQKIEFKASPKKAVSRNPNFDSNTSKGSSVKLDKSDIDMKKFSTNTTSLTEASKRGEESTINTTTPASPKKRLSKHAGKKRKDSRDVKELYNNKENKTKKKVKWAKNEIEVVDVASFKQYNFAIANNLEQDTNKKKEETTALVLFFSLY